MGWCLGLATPALSECHPELSALLSAPLRGPLLAIHCSSPILSLLRAKPCFLPPNTFSVPSGLTGIRLLAEAG